MYVYQCVFIHAGIHVKRVATIIAHGDVKPTVELVVLLLVSMDVLITVAAYHLIDLANVEQLVVLAHVNMIAIITALGMVVDPCVVLKVEHPALLIVE